MSIIFFFHLLFILFLFLHKRGNNGYVLLIFILSSSLLIGPLIGNSIQFVTLETLFNVLFVYINLYLIVSPWRFVKFRSIRLISCQLRRFSSVLNFVLIATMIINLVVLSIVYVFMPDISRFKSEKAFLLLYERIPYFSFFFRYTATTQYLGYLAIPLSSYYFYKNEKPKALKFFILSLTSITSALAMYSRAGILTFALTSAGFYLLNFSLYSRSIQDKLSKYIKNTLFTVGIILLTITIIRFGAMDYYEDRIPQESLIKNPVAYNFFDYASQGFPNGIDHLELRTADDIMGGEITLYSIKQILSYFGIINWSSETAQEIYQKTWNKQGLSEKNDAGSFHGYTATLINDFGYVATLIINLIYFIFVYMKCKRNYITLDSMFILVLLFIQPCVAIFYSSYGEMIVPLLFYLIFAKIPQIIFVPTTSK